jgi:hypothetical protein
MLSRLPGRDRLDDPKVAQDVALFVQTLTELPLRVKIFITSRFTQSLRRVLEKLHPPVHRSFLLPPLGFEERRAQMDAASHMSEADKGTPLIS